MAHASERVEERGLLKGESSANSWLQFFQCPDLSVLMFRLVSLTGAGEIIPA
jgi:hypothetical protein